MKTEQRRRAKKSKPEAKRSTGRASEPSMGLVAQNRKATASRTSTDAFRSRRQSVRRQQGRRRLHVVLAFCVVCVAALAFIGFLNSSAFDVEEILVAGANRASEQEIVEASGIEVGEPLLGAKNDQAVTNIEQVAWVGSVEVDRNWNGRIDITVIERDPLVAMPTAAGFALVDHWGRQLDAVAAAPSQYFVVDGPEVSGKPGHLVPRTAEPLLAFADVASPTILSAVESVDADQSGLLIKLKGSGVVKMGDANKMAEKILAFETMLASVNLACLDTLDIRVPTAPALTRTESSSTTESGDSEDPNERALDC